MADLFLLSEAQMRRIEGYFRRCHVNLRKSRECRWSKHQTAMAVTDLHSAMALRRCM